MNDRALYTSLFRELCFPSIVVHLVFSLSSSITLKKPETFFLENLVSFPDPTLSYVSTFPPREGGVWEREENPVQCCADRPPPRTDDAWVRILPDTMRLEKCRDQSLTWLI